MKTEQFLKESGIEMTDFISSSSYDAVVKMVDKLRQAAVSGSLPFIPIKTCSICSPNECDYRCKRQ